MSERPFSLPIFPFRSVTGLGSVGVAALTSLTQRWHQRTAKYALPAIDS